MKRLLSIATFCTLLGAGLIGLTEDNLTFYSRMDGLFEKPGMWASAQHDGPSNDAFPDCRMSGKTVVHIQDSIISHCDLMVLSGNAELHISSGGQLRLQGGLELLGNSRLIVDEGATLTVASGISTNGRSSIELNGSLTSYGAVEVQGQSTICGRGSSKVGGSISGLGWCLDLAVLPIELISLEARLNTDENVRLSWTSLLESESDDFLIERSSNGMSFQKIAEVEGMAESDMGSTYSYEDQGLKPGLYYYRISQVGSSGETEAIELIAATIERDPETGLCSLEIDPNPCVPACTVTLSDCPGSAFRAVLMDGAGRMVSELIPVNTRDRESKIQYYLNEDNFTMPGVYILRAQSENSDISEKLIIQ